ncbi:MAG: TIGR03960 family B12-binding radical SAM protein [Acidimicrobiia bacterium]|nr:TIGR03960 family B12-binding radical SAM protein [Acidimicrobiia bacterium]MYC58116.1 TIGR03960 family B12-binding radical SAM protein [Acidimicrobiia bacterium]MYI30548.1 TIGR03960 family B12-binding radical SAM protein [Acidimicrobiia bacterium]
MMSLWPELELLLPDVAKPARYIGGEGGMLRPEHHHSKVAWLLTYPDTYEIGLPNQGLQILYEILNEASNAVAERAYAPWVDMEAQMRSAGLPLFSVDTHRSAADFDVLAFNLSAELVYTNVLNCINLAGVRVRAEERASHDLLIGAGGHCTYNPEPLADFVDFFVLGDGEEVVSEINAVVCDWKQAGKRSRHEVLRALATVDGVYVPSLYEVTYEGAALVSVVPKFDDVPSVVEKRTVADLSAWPYPKNQLVPLTEVVHDRLNVEVFRGCTRGCRFCQAGMITRPVRERPASQVRTMIAGGLARTGYDEVALTSLSTADYSGIEEAVAVAMSGCGAASSIGVSHEPVPVSVSLPSLRVDAFTVGLAAQIQQVRRTGLTFAPEAGSWRMRKVINKLIDERDLYGAVESAFSQGWRRMKFYFLTGLPTETDEDTLAIGELARKCVELGRVHTKNPSVTVSLGGFVPKPFTPFQWFGQNTVAELQRKVFLLRDSIKRHRGVQMKWHDPRASLAEGIASRGDRRVGRVIQDVWEQGGTFQEWSEHFEHDRWVSAMERHGLSLDWYVYRHRTQDEVLPWDHISAGLHKDFLWQDWRDGLNEVGLEDCRWTPCYDCGACTGYSIEHIVASAVPPAGGSQGTGQVPTSYEPLAAAKPAEVKVQLGVSGTKATS